MKEKKIIVLILLVLVILSLSGVSYAYLKASQEGKDNNIALANFGVILQKDMEEMDASAFQMPLADEEGLKNTPVTFEIFNKGNVTANYKVSLVDKDIVSTLKNENIRYQLKRKVGTGEYQTLEIKNLGVDGLLDEGAIEANQVISYELVCWVDYNVETGGGVFKKYLKVDGESTSNLDKSGANYPELLPNMIPVYYDESTSSWKKADETNRNVNFKWFDYNDFMWANAVTIKETNGTLNEDKSMSFDGVDDYLELGHENSQFEQTITAVLRFKINNFPTNENFEMLAKDRTFYLGIQNTGRKIYFSLYIDGTSWNHLNANFNTELDTWYTVVGTYDGEKEKVYINGELVGSVDVANFSIKNANNFISLGGNIDANRCFSNITASDVFIYKDALTAEEVEKYFKGEITDYPKDNLVVSKTEFDELDTRQKYLESATGTEIKMDDISTMWVWIPRYKYTIFNGNNGTATEQIINVEFEHGIDTTGTVKCHDNILTADDSASSEICTDETNGNIINGKSTYTHPAFTFGDEELVGFWFAKFEVSTDDVNCSSTPSSENCNKIGINMLIKPDKVSLANQDLSYLFANFRNMETYGNIHGFVQNEKATSYLDANGNLSGDILNDDNNYDIHMIKNMEWGAVAYLTMSKYGKYGNSLYVGANKEVYNNNYRTTVNGIDVVKTGYSGKSPKAAASTNGALYNNLTKTDDQGYAGAGASTTGTIYGVYDMAGGNVEFVMANNVNKEGKFEKQYANSWNENNIPLRKYYDAYSYITNKSTISITKLGDASKEVAKNFELNNSLWWKDSYKIDNNNWQGRGGLLNNGVVFRSDRASGALGKDWSSRPVLTVSREFPWLNN